MEIITGIHIWNILGCMAIAGLYTFFLYGFKRKQSTLPPNSVWLLAALRFISVFILCFLFINPIIEKKSTYTEPAVLIVGVDASQSMQLDRDSTQFTDEVNTYLTHLKSQLSENLEIVQVAFGSKVVDSDMPIEFKDKETNFGEFFDFVKGAYPANQIGGVVIISDGNFNQGSHPLYYPFHGAYPIYTLGAGDTTRYPDSKIQKVRANELLYLGNSSEISVWVGATDLQGKSLLVSLYEGNQLLKSQKLVCNSPDFLQEVNFVIKPSTAGMKHYTVKVKSGVPEKQLLNNSQNIYIDVIDNTDKVLLIAHGVHPDVSAIKQALGIKKSIELEVTLGTNFTGDLTRYDVVITHNMIQDKYQSFWNELNQQKTPVWIIQGANFSSRLFEAQIPNQEFELVNRSPVAISGVLDSDFSLFEISNLNTDVLKRYPPLLGNLLEFSPSEDMDVLLHQQLGMVQTKNPLWFFTKRNGVKTSVLMGTGIWRWRMSEFKQNENFENYDHLISKTIQYLTVKEDKSQFRLQYEHSFTENEDVQIDAYVYNKALELVADQDVAIKVKNEEGKEFSYLFTPQSNKYSLKIPGLAPGQYSFVATCFFGQNQLTKQGAFTIKEIDVEFAQTKANHTLLQKISQNTQAKFYPYSERELLLNELKTPERFPATLYANTENNPLISLFWITGLILILLALEWILRKMWGQV